MAAAPKPLVAAFADFNPLDARLTISAPAVPASAPIAAAPPTAPSASAAASSAAPSAAPSPPSRPRRRGRRSGRTPQQGGTATHPVAAAGEISAPAPWDLDPEAEAAEKREDARKALREAIRAKREGRTGRQALQARSQAQQQEDAPMGAFGGQEAPLEALAGMDAKTLQALLKSAGVAGDVAPSMRKLRRKIEAMGSGSAVQYLASRAAAATTKRA